MTQFENKKQIINQNYLHSELTAKILKAYFNVYNQLGFGFLEKVYENSMMIELRRMNLDVKNQYPINVFYDNIIVGEYFADIFVENKVIIELKAAVKLLDKHEAQLVNYLRATNVEVGLLLNFGKKPDYTRRVLTKTYK